MSNCTFVSDEQCQATASGRRLYCLHVYGPVTYYECSYTSLPQCAASASGRSAQCVINPYQANAYADPVPRRYRRYRHVY